MKILAAFAIALAISSASADAQAPRVTPGISVLVTDSIHLIRGKRVGLITNHTGVDERGVSSIDLLHRAPGVRLTALFAPEHGIRGVAEGGAMIASSVDRATGVPIHSLYGVTKVPTARMLARSAIQTRSRLMGSSPRLAHVPTHGRAPRRSARHSRPPRRR